MNLRIDKDSPSSIAPLSSGNVEQRLQLSDQFPVIRSGELVPIILRPLAFWDLVATIEFLKHVDRLSRDHGVEYILVFELTTIHGLIGAFDLDCN